MAAKAAEAPSRSDNTVIGEAGLLGQSHDLSHGARGAWPARQRREIAVCDDAAGGNPSQRVQYAARERRGSHLK